MNPTDSLKMEMFKSKKMFDSISVVIVCVESDSVEC